MKHNNGITIHLRDQCVQDFGCPSVNYGMSCEPCFCQSFVVDEAVVMLGVVVLGVMGEAVVMLGVVELGVLVVDKAMLQGVV